ncbi:MAG: anaerobic ribonucleoside-triphosphate reductase, partial [Candidatus Thorarchaeota archaeon]
TRLGTPPFEVFKLFDPKNNQINPDKFIEKLGSDVSEQFLLLNLLPKNLADLYLSGEIALLHLNYWALKPLSIYIDTETIMDYLIKEHTDLKNKINKKVGYTELIILFSDLLYYLKKFYSEDLVLGNFNNQFLSKFPKAISSDFSLLTSRIVRFNNKDDKTKSSITLEFNYNGCPAEQESIDEAFLKSINTKSKNQILPFFIFEYSQNDKILNLVVNNLKNNAILYDKFNSNIFNSSVIQIPNAQTNQVILDKILINLHNISVEANQNDEKFLELLQEKINAVFELFNHKEKLVQKKLNSLKQWNFIISNLMNTNANDIIKNALKSISFFGLNEAIFTHCGIELDKTENSESFALKILNFMKKIIIEKNNKNGRNFILSQPHYDTYLENSFCNGRTQHNQKISGYTSNLIRNESKLSINKKIALFKKFQNIFDRGSLFTLETIKEEKNSLKIIKSLIESKISTVLLKECIQ